MGRWRSSTPLSMVSACIISPHSSYHLHHLPLFKVRVLVCFILTCWLWVFRVLPFTGVESSLSMDEVLRKRYRGKLEYREVDLVDRFPPPRRMDQLALTAAPSAPLQVRQRRRRILCTPARSLLSCPWVALAPLWRVAKTAKKELSRMPDECKQREKLS